MIVNKPVFWLLILAIFAGTLYLLSDILAPFVIAFIFAYLFQPLVEKNAKKFHIPRSLIAGVVLLIFVSIFIIALFILLPLIYYQIEIFIHKIPLYKTSFDNLAQETISKLKKIDPAIADRASETIYSLVNSIFSFLGSAANNIWNYTLATVGFFIILIIVSVILYYFLRDWPKIVKTIESMLPLREKSTIRHIFKDINNLLSAYIRGQINICLLMAVYYTTGLSLIGIDLAVLLGIIAGFLIIIPLVGNIISLSLMLLNCYLTYGASNEMLYVFTLTVFGYLLESYYLTPKIIGNKIGLHPVWIIFAFFAAGAIFGFVGILFAVPIAGIIKVLVSYLINYYKSSSFYKD